MVFRYNQAVSALTDRAKHFRSVKSSGESCCRSLRKFELHSAAYAAATAVRQIAEIQPAAVDVLTERGKVWRQQVTSAFLARYRAAWTGILLTSLLALPDAAQPVHADA